MQIDPVRLQKLTAAGVEKVSAAQAEGVETATAASPAEAVQHTDKLALSQQATEVQAAHEALAAVPETRAELVERLKTEVQTGTYQVDAEKIAEKLV